MLIIALTLYVLLMFRFLLIAISMVLPSTFLIKTSSLVLTIAVDCIMVSGKYQKINLLASKCSTNSGNMNIVSFFFIYLLFFNLLRKLKNDPRLKIILTGIAFLVFIIYRFSKPHNKLKSCLTFQFFTHGTIEITNKVNTSHSQSQLSIFAISKFRFQNENSFCPLLLLLSGDTSLNPGHFSNPQLFKEEEWRAFSNRGLHLIHLNINSLLPKIDE